MLVDIDSVLITGGAGFIGSNLALALAEHNIDITILDLMSDEYGGNLKNIEPISSSVDFRKGDVRNRGLVMELVEDVDVVFHLAAQLSRPLSMDNPQKDLEINCEGTINVLEALREQNPEARLVYTGSQASFGIPAELPLTEDTPDNPIDVYGANKLSSENYCNIYHNSWGISTVMLRLTNVYGPRSQLMNPNYGVINKFLRLAMENKTLTVYEPGTMQRDPIFVDDVVNALIRATTYSEAVGEKFVIGSGNPISIYELAENIVDTVGRGEVEMTEWPENWESIRAGDIYVDPSYASDVISWEPETSLEDGLRQTVNFFRRNRDHYLSDG